jgi:hypothetical protein
MKFEVSGELRILNKRKHCDLFDPPNIAIVVKYWRLRCTRRIHVIQTGRNVIHRDTRSHKRTHTHTNTRDTGE